MNRNTLLILITTLAAAVMLLPFLIFQMVPDRVIQQFLSQSLGSQGLTLQAKQLGKAFPFGLKATDLSVGDRSTSYVALDQVSLRLRLLPILTGRIIYGLQGTIGPGSLSGEYNLFPGKKGSIQIENLEIASIPALTHAIEGSIKGTLSLDGSFRQTTSGMAGEAKLRIKSVALAGAKLSAMPLPDLTVPETRGVLKLNGSTINIDNLAMQGEGIYLRLSGLLPLISSAPLALTLEMMPSAELMERQKSVFLIMFPYLVAPGQYKLPIGGTLSSPQLARR